MIRKFDKADLQDILDIWLEGNAQAHHFIPESYWKSNLKFMTEALPKAEVYVYRKGGEVIGFAGLQGNHIAGLFVRSGHRSRGIGHELTSFLRQSHNALTLCVYEKNEKAVEFYLSDGFSIVSKNMDEATGEYEFMMSWERGDNRPINAVSKF